MPTDWEKIEVEGIAPEGAEQVSMACTFHDTGRVWYDDAEVWLENPPEVLEIDRPEPTSVDLSDDARGVAFEVEGARFMLTTGGEPTELGGLTLQTNGTLACVGDRQPTEFVYMQEGTSVTYDGLEILRTDTPITVCMWHGGDDVVHVLAYDDLTPHAAAIAPEDLRVTVLAATAITEAMSGDTPIKATDNGDGTWTLGGPR